MSGPAAVAHPLSELLDQLQSKGLRRGLTDASAALRPPIPTGHAGLDAALRTGGLPRGSLTLLDAAPGSGATSVALGVLAAAQRNGGLAAYLDLDRSFDPATAARLGVQLDWLLVVRPERLEEAVELAGWLARSRLIDALVLDLLGTGRIGPLGRHLDRLATLLTRTAATGLLLTDHVHREAGAQAAGIRIALDRKAWLAIGHDLVGQRVEATVTRHRWAAPGGHAELDLWFAEGRRIDPLLARLAVPRAEPASPVPARALHILSA